MDPIEALADGIHQFEGWHKDSRSWRNRNPGNLRPYLAFHVADADNYRVFPTLSAGWLALTADLTAKFAGSHGLKKDSTLLDLLNIYAPGGDYNDPSAYTKFICVWTSHILGREITPSTTLAGYLGK